MQAVRTKNTGPEIAVRRLTHSMGYRYRLHQRDLPGKPDLSFPGRRKVLFVHGCYWHGHGCPKGRLPKSSLDYWGPKIARNKQRDSENEESLRHQGWDVMTVWQCEVFDSADLRDRIVTFLGPANKIRSTR